MSQSNNRWVCLCAGVVMMLVSGIIYAWSILKAPLEAEFGWSGAALGLNFTITMCGFCVGGILGGLLTKRLSARVSVLLAGVLVFLGFFLTSRMRGGIGMLYGSYGVLCGVGIGIVYNVVIATVTARFPDKRATASGALMMGFGASSLVLGSATSGLINGLGWRAAYLILGVGIIAVLAAGSFFLPARVEKGSGKTGPAATRDIAPRQMVGMSSFWRFYLFSILISAIGTCVISLGKDVAVTVGASESTAVLLVGVLSVCNGLGRILTGLLFDAIGRARTMLASNGLAILSMALMLAAVSLHSAPLVVAGLVAVGLTYGSMPPVSSGFVSSVYGPTHFALNFSIANTMLFPASFSATIGGGILEATGSYRPLFALLLGCAVLGLLLNLSLRRVPARTALSAAE